MDHADIPDFSTLVLSPAAGLTTGKMSQLDDTAIDAIQPVAGVNAGVSVVFGLLGNAQQLAVDVRISGIIG